MKLKIRVLSLMLCILMVLTIVPGAVFASEGASVSCGGAKAEKVTVSECSAAVLSLDAAAQSRQWEIYIPGAGIWADILGCTGASLTVTNAMVNNAMDGSGTAKVRCAYTIDDEQLHSQVVCITVDHSANEAMAVLQPAPVLMMASAPVMAAEEPAAEEEGIRYTISIQYLFEDGSVAANPYTATIPEGTDFSYTVTNPVIAGYTAYCDEAVSSEIAIDVTDIREDLSYTVVYKPADVNYTVKHLYQNVEGTGYPESETAVYQAKTGSIIPEGLARVKDGFYALPFVRPVVEADGSTEVEIRYNRQYYLLNFDIADGYGTESIYAPYGAAIPVSSIGEPVREGYIFDVWLPSVPSTMPVNGMTCVAQWIEEGDTPYTIVYWHENADDDGYTQYATKTMKTKTGAVVSGRSGDTFTGSNDTEHKNHFTFDRADQNVTVEGDGTTVVNVYYKRKVYTTTFDLGSYSGTSTKRMTIGGKTYTSLSGSEKYKIVAKYGATIAHLWPLEENFEADDHFYRWQYTSSSNYWVTKQHYMTNQYLLNNTLRANYKDLSSEIIAYYMLESFDQSPSNPEGGSFEAGNFRKKYNGVYYDMSTLYSQKVTSTLDAWSTQKELDGTKIVKMVEDASTNPDSVYMYYTRNRHVLTVYTGPTEKIHTVSNVMFEQPLRWFQELAGYMAGGVPKAPADLEEGAYQFAGWYSTAEFYEGTEVDLNTFIMPDNDAFLYAKWVPVTRTVRTYQSKEALEAGAAPLATYTATHKTKVEETVSDPINGNDFFIGWFYMDSNEEKAFDFGSMAVLRDMDVYAKWSPNPIKTYMVHYQLEDGTPVADSTVGEDIVGTVLIFNAKGGTDLYPEYQTGYYADRQSDSVTIGSDNAGNTITFVYAPAADVPYTVKYLERNSRTALRSEKTVSDNKSAVVTEQFEPVPGYIPDAFQKDLVIIPGQENVLIFWYEKDEVNIRYRISHYIQDVEGDGFSKEYTYTEAAAVIGTEIKALPVDIPGFTVDHSVAGTLTEAEVTAQGAHLKLYYTRNMYPYEIRYLEDGTNTPIKETVSAQARYGSEIAADAETIPGYLLINGERQKITIAAEESSTADKNVITFYYSEEQAEIRYEVVGPAGSGTVTPASEQIPARTGSAQGASAESSGNNFRFAGWYLDEDCTMEVPALQVSGTKFTPVKNSGTGLYEDAVYYAKFEYNIADLTITKSGVADVNAPFVFRVSGEGVELDVVVYGSGSATVKDLPSGKYTVIEIAGYWRYGLAGSQTVTLSGQPQEVTFTGSRGNDRWLDDYAGETNQIIR